MQPERLYIDGAKRRVALLRRSVKLAAQWLEWETGVLTDIAAVRFRKTFITLTYAKLTGWKPRHISAFLHLMRQWFKSRKHVCRFVWVAEFQKRGAVHYHVMVWVPSKLLLPKPDVCGWWPHGMSNVQTARSPVGYMVKYASKVKPQDVARPFVKGLRLHGSGGAGDFARMLIRSGKLPRWFHEGGNSSFMLGSAADMEAVGLVAGELLVEKCKGGLRSKVSDEYYPTPWDLRIDDFGRYLVRKSEVNSGTGE